MKTALTTKPNRRIALFIAAIMALTLWAGFPLGASAASTDTEIDLTDTSKTSGTNWTYNYNVFTINSGANVTIIGTTTTSRVEVAENATNVTITLSNASITSSSTTPFKLNTGANATIKLQNTNTLTTTANNNAGLNAPTGTTLTVTSASGDKSTEGNLTATGGQYGAGIGGGDRGAGGTIEINGGTVTANGGTSGAGIGGGRDGAGGNITINGGTVNAQSADGAAGIGGGDGYLGGGAGGTIEITGGTVTATGGKYGAGIGGGDGYLGGGGGAGGTIEITGGIITATGGTSGAGIGGGRNAAGGNITITGAPVITVNNGAGGTVTIENATAYIKGNITVQPTITDSIVLVNGTVTGKTTDSTTGLLIDDDVTIDTSKYPSDPIEVTLKENLTIPAGSVLTIPKDVKLIVSTGKTLTATGDFFLDQGGSFDCSGATCLSAFSGAPVSDIELTEITSSSITIKTPTITAHDNGTQKIEYITSNTADLPQGTWTEVTEQNINDGTVTISGVTPQSNLYYVFVRSKEVSPYNAGKAKSLPAVLVNVTFDTQQGSEAPAAQSNILYNGTVAEVADPTKDGYVFMGWYPAPDGKGTAYVFGTEGTKLNAANGVNISTVPATITLHAYWVQGTKTSCGGLTYAGTNASCAGNVLTLANNANGVITGTSTTARVEIAANATVNVILNNANILSTTASPFKLGASANAEIKLAGTNALTTTAGNNPGLNVPSGTTLTITSATEDGSTEGTLTVTGGGNAAGIGGGNTAFGGTIKIAGGTVIANGGSNAAGIGTGFNPSISNTTSIQITGGNVTANGGQYGAGIGGGNNTDGGTIKIEGGNVAATSAGAAAGIGGGVSQGAGNITITGGIIKSTGGALIAGYSAGVGIGVGGNNGKEGSIAISGTTIIETASGIGGTDVAIAITNATAYIKGNITIQPTITNSIVLVNGTVTGKSSSGATGLLIGDDVTIDTSKYPSEQIEVTLKESLTIPEGSAFTIPKGVKVIVSEGKTLTVADGAGFFLDTGGSIEGTGTFPSTYSGAFVSGIEVTSITNNKITITKPVQTEHANETQAVEYAHNTTGTLPEDGWQDASSDTIDISPLDPNKIYYIFARSKAANPYKSGAAKSTEVKTLYPVTVTFDTQQGSAVTPSPQSKLSTETVDEVSETTRQGYTFDGWYSQQNGDGTAYTLGAGGTQLSEATGVDLQENAGTITLYAKWIEKTGYKVVYDTQGATTGTINNKENVKWTDDSLLPSAQVEKTGYTPPQWNVTANGTKAGVLGTDKYSELAISDIPESITLTAVWSPRTDIPLTFNANGGTDGSPTSWSDLTFGQTISAKGKTLPAKDTGAPTRTGYTFSGWSTTEGSSNSADFDESATVDWTTKIVYAVWTAKPVTITYEAAGGSDPSGGTATGTLGGQIGTLATTSKTGYSFVWKNGGTVYSTETVLSEAAGVVLTGGEGNNTLTLTADWTADPVAIIYELNAGDDETAGLTNTPSDAGTYHSAIATFPAATRTGYTLEGWYADEEVADNEYEDGTAISAGVTYDSGYKLKLYAKWSAKSVAVNYQYNYGTAGVYDTASGIYDGKIDAAPTAPIRAGYTFGGWFKDEAAKNAWIFGDEGTALNADNGVENADEAEPALSLYAKWTANPPQTYAVTVTGGTGGGSFAAGDKVSITADTLSGKIFDSWTGGVDFADESSPTTTFVMPANAVTVTATYKNALVVAPPGSQVEEEGENIKVTLPEGGGTVVVPPGSTVMSGENKGEIEVTLSSGDIVIVPPGSTVTSGENEGEIEVTLPDGGGSVIVPPGSTVMSSENEGEIEVTLPSGDIVIVPPGATVDAEGNVTAPPDNPPVITGSWVYGNGVWKYLINGEAKTGWLYDTGYKAWFYFGESGTMQTGWVYNQNDKAWYYLAANGKMVAGKWLHDTDGRWYYLSGNGKMLTGKQTIGGEVYSFRGNGVWIG